MRVALASSQDATKAQKLHSTVVEGFLARWSQEKEGAGAKRHEAPAATGSGQTLGW